MKKFNLFDVYAQLPDSWVEEITPEDNKRKCFGGGRPSGPSTSTVQQTNLPEYAKPYVTTMMGQGQALTNVNDNPYQPYPEQKTAPFNAMQQQGFSNAANQQVAGQLGAGSNLAYAGGLSSLGAASQYQPGQIGMLGVGTGAMTDPGTMASYMNPYQQNVVDIQKREAMRDNQKQLIAQHGQAVQGGAFGGSRQAIQDTELSRGLTRQLSDIEQQGMQAAYGQAQQGYQTDAARQLAAQQANQQAFGAAQGQGLQSAQYGAGLNLQGAQAAMQGAGVLGQLGQEQFAQQQGVTKGLMEAGQQQQLQAQELVNQRYQEFLNQKQYPYQQLGFMSDLLRGLPLAQQSSTMYAPPPSLMSQAAGLGAGGVGMAKAFGTAAAAGGKVTENHIGRRRKGLLGLAIANERG